MAKVLIDIPEQYLKLIHSDSPINWVSMSGFLNFVRNGIVLDGLTNGEVIKKMFPHYDIEIDEHKGYVRVFYEDFYTTYPLAWWNRKWGE